ncbi:MAG: DUF3179 domain-containing protein [Dehalococcoidia bacterium]
MCRQRITRRQLGGATLLSVAALAAACTGGSSKPTTGGSENSVGVAPSPGTTAPVERLSFSQADWKTDFSRHSVALSEISSGGPGKDGIPAIDTPTFLSLEQGDRAHGEREPVIAFEHQGDARAYPLSILIWHEIVNDTVGGLPVTVTFCPLCNTAIAFDRTLEGLVYDFGTTGNLRHSDLVMYDRQTESWWQQVTGEAIVGELTGRRLTFLPATIVSWAEFKSAHPQGKVLSSDTGFDRDYGTNPYTGYDDADEPPFLFRGDPDGRLPPKERVVTISLGGEDVAYPWSVLEKLQAINDSVGGRPVVVFWREGTVSALDKVEIERSRDVGAAAVFAPVVDGRHLTFRAADGAFIDGETGSRWTLLGKATSGPLAGRQLESIVNANHFWFAWAVFKPQTRVYRAQ